MKSVDELNERAKELIGKYFPERQVFFRTNGRVDYHRIEAPQQIAACAVVAALVGWIGFATWQVVARDDVLIAKQSEIENLAKNNDALETEIGELENDVMARASALESRQEYLNDLLTSGQSVADQNLIKAAAEEQLETAETAGPEVATPKPEAALGVRRGPSLASLVGISPAQASTGDDRFVGSAVLLDRLQRIEAEQAGLARGISDSRARVLSDINQMIADLGLRTEELIAQASPGMGGPLIEETALDSLALFTGITDEATRSAFELVRTTTAELDRIRSLLDSFPTTVPTDKYYLSSRFGRRKDPIRKVWAQHNGIDMAGWPGTEILTAAKGTVKRAGRWGAYGNMVEIDHGNGFLTRYGHLSRISVKKGQHIAEGDLIGKMGSSGRSTSTHLHFEIWFAGQPRDPLPFVKAIDHVREIKTGNGNG